MKAYCLVYSMIILLAVVLDVQLFGFADAQTPDATKSQKVYGAWILECAILDQKPSAKTTGPIPRPGSIPDFELPKRKACQVTQTFKNKKTGNEFARLAFAPDPKRKNGMVIGLRTPVDVSFDVPVRVSITEKKFVDGHFKRCVKEHCFAFLFPKPSDLKTLNNAKNATLQFPISDGRSIRFPMSTNGLESAIDALKKNIK